MKLTKRQEWMFNYVKYSDDWVSPTEVGRAYGEHLHGKGHPKTYTYHSASASPVLKKLVDMGFLKRDSNGHYKYL